MGLKRGLLDMLSAEQEAGRSTERRIMEALGLTLFLSFIAAMILSVIWWFVFSGNILLIAALAFVVPAITITDVYFMPMFAHFSLLRLLVCSGF